MWQRFIHGVEQFRVELLGGGGGGRRPPSRRNSQSSNDECSITLEIEEEGDNGCTPQTQDEANAAFVRAYASYINRHQAAGDLYCCMIPLAACWWMPRAHPVVTVLRNSGMTQVGQAQRGQLVAFANQDVERAMLEIATWFDKEGIVKQKPECSFP
jgi:uncharacterized protein YpbB